MSIKNTLVFASLLSVASIAFAETENAAPAATQVSDATENTKTLKAGETYTIYMGREARNITIDWAEGTDCEFEIEISCGHGVFTSVYSDKAKGKGKKTYTYIRTSVEDLRIVIKKGKATINNLSTLSNKAEDSCSYNPI